MFRLTVDVLQWKKSKTSHIFIWISRSSCKHTANTFFSSFRSNADNIAFVCETDNWWLDSLGTCFNHILKFANDRKNASSVGAECSFCCSVANVCSITFFHHDLIQPALEQFLNISKRWLQPTSGNVSHMRGKHTAHHWNTFRGRCEITHNFSFSNFGSILIYGNKAPPNWEAFLISPNSCKCMRQWLSFMSTKIHPSRETSCTLYVHTRIKITILIYIF